MLTDAVKELEEVLKSLKPPTVQDLKGAHLMMNPLEIDGVDILEPWDLRLFKGRQMHPSLLVV